MTKTILGTLIVGLLGNAAVAFACLPNTRYIEVRTKNDMYAHLLLKNYIVVDEVRSLKISDYDMNFAWVKNDSGYMCHDKETTSAVYDIEYVQTSYQWVPGPNGDYSRKETVSDCKLIAKVSAVYEHFEGGSKPQYSIENVNEKNCVKREM